MNFTLSESHKSRLILENFKENMSFSLSSAPLLNIPSTKNIQNKISLKPSTDPNLHPGPTTKLSNLRNSPLIINRRDTTFTLASFCLTSVFSQFPSFAAEESTASQCSFVITNSGLAYCDKVVGFGPEAAKGQLIKAHYTGRLENGKVFDSSYNRGKPLTFRVGVGEVIKGWDQGIIGGNGVPPMLTGGKRTLKIPPELGYGMRGAGCKGGSCIIPPDSTLLFDVEFVGKA